MRLFVASFLLLATPLYAQTTPVDVTPPGVISARDVSLDPGEAGHLAMTGYDSAGLVIRETFDAGASWVQVAPPNTNWFGEVHIDANGDLIAIGSNTPVGGANLPIARRLNGTWVGLPVPLPNGAHGTLSVGPLATHPVDARSMAVVTAEFVGDDASTTIYRAYATKDDGMTWTLLTSSSMTPDDGGVRLARLWYMHTDQETRILIHRDYTDQSWEQTDVSSWSIDPVASFAETGNAGVGYRCTVVGARTEPGLRFAVVPNNGSSVPVPVERRFALGSWAPVGDAGLFTDIAAGNVDPRLVVRHSLSSTRAIQVSRDAGESWSTLVDLTAASYRHREFVGLSAYDDALYEVAQEGVSGSGPIRLLRIPVETALGAEECPGIPNSTGVPGELAAIGLPEVSGNRLLLSIRNLPPQHFYLPLVSPDAGLIVNPGGSDGNLCLSGDIGRILDAVGRTTLWGEGTAPIDLTQLPGPSGFSSVFAGDTRRFQVWYRDGGSSSGTNLTNSIAITFE